MWQVWIVIAMWVVTFRIAAQETSPDLSQILPVDPEVTIGTLENGLRYYIRANQRPENRAELRLVVNAGSVLEDDDQQGLAHFAEHMAFNGTTNFSKQALIDYMESVGMRLGADVNASTGFDETIYELQIPTDDQAILGQAFQILEDWAHLVSFEPEEIEKERGVVIEEWRLGRGAGARMTDKQLPVLLKDSRYAERLPIGQKAVLDTFRHDTLRRFYREWYHPELMAVVAVGDFDKIQIEGLIQQHFSGLTSTEEARERPVFPVPEHEETLFAIASDPEATFTDVVIGSKLEVRSLGTLASYRQALIESLYRSMLNDRMTELSLQIEAPFLFASAFEDRIVRPLDTHFLGAAAKPNGIEEALEAVLTEAERAKRHGFIASELSRRKEVLLTGFEQGFQERDKTRSGLFVREYIRHFLTGEPIPGIVYEYDMVQKLIPDITLEELNEVAQSWMTDQNRVVLVSSPEGPGVLIPSEDDLRAVIDRVTQKEIRPYQEALIDQPLVEVLPTAGEVVSERTVPELGVTEWTLANGVRVVLKPTDFQNNQILFDSFSPGGHSLVPDADYIAAVTATDVMREGGLGDFDQTQLRRKLAGKVVQVSPQIGELQESVSGRASPEDVETLFQLIYLTFTAPRQDSLAFLSFQTFLRDALENSSASPQSAFSDTIQVTMTQHHFRARPVTAEIVNEMDFEKSVAIYRDRFADAGDFTFFFVGNLELDTLKPLVQTYLGGLPSAGRQETWGNVGVRPPEGVIEKIVRRGLEPSSQTQILFTGPFEWSRQNRFELNAMVRLLQIKLRETLREDLGQTYGASVRASTSHYPKERYQVQVGFGSAPENVESLTSSVFTLIDSLQRFGPSQTDLDKVREQLRRGREPSLQQNRFWLSSLQFAYFHEEDPLDILKFNDRVDSLTVGAVQQAFVGYLNVGNFVRVVLHPEGFGLVGDFNGDGAVDFQDFLLFAGHFDRKQGDADFDARFDLNGDGAVNFPDFVAFADQFGTS